MYLKLRYSQKNDIFDEFKRGKRLITGWFMGLNTCLNKHKTSWHIKPIETYTFYMSNGSTRKSKIKLFSWSVLFSMNFPWIIVNSHWKVLAKNSLDICFARSSITLTKYLSACMSTSMNLFNPFVVFQYNGKKNDFTFSMSICNVLKKSSKPSQHF